MVSSDDERISLQSPGAFVRLSSYLGQVSSFECKSLSSVIRNLNCLHLRSLHVGKKSHASPQSNAIEWYSNQPPPSFVLENHWRNGRLIMNCFQGESTMPGLQLVQPRSTAFIGRSLSLAQVKLQRQRAFSPEPGQFSPRQSFIAFPTFFLPSILINQYRPRFLLLMDYSERERNRSEDVNAFTCSLKIYLGVVAVYNETEERVEGLRRDTGRQVFYLDSAQLFSL